MNVPRALALLRGLHVGPRAVARGLGCTETAVSNWAAGRHRMSPAYQAAFVALLRETVQHAKALSRQERAPVPMALSIAPMLPAEPYPPERHPALAYLARLSAVGREGMRHRLNVAARLLSGGRAHGLSFPWHQLTYVHVRALRTHLAETTAPRTANTTLHAVKGVLKECWRLELMTAEHWQRAVDVESVRGTRLPAGRALEPEEVVKLFASCREDARVALGARDAAMLAVLYGLGLRRAEAASLDLADYDVAKGTLRVHGKGNKERLAYPTGACAQALQAWLVKRGSWEGPLFVPVRQEHVQATRLDVRSVYATLRNRADRAGVPHFSPHDLRRTFVSVLIDQEVDLFTIYVLAGHSDVKTMQLYDRRGERAKQAAMPRLSFPTP